MGPGRLQLLRGVLARLPAGRAEVGLPEQALEAERMLRSQAKAARARRLRKLMEPPGPPERTLTRQAMEQIRYLSREWPEEWPVGRLARGFQVQPEVVRRILRSRFSPSPERSRRQDAQAGGGGGRQSTLAREATFRLLPASSAAARARLAVPQARAGRAPVAAERASAGQGRRAPGGGEADWDGQRLSEAEEEREPRRGVVQRGREFFDGNGNFLYRIPGGAPTGGDAA